MFMVRMLRDTYDRVNQEVCFVNSCKYHQINASLTPTDNSSQTLLIEVETLKMHYDPQKNPACRSWST